MKKNIPYILLFLIVILRLALRVVPLLNNNIYFTVDQGKTVLYVREILEQHRIFLKGPETSIAGVHAGPLWYYFEAIGYGIFGGNPIGGVLVLTILKLGVVVAFTLWIRKKIGWAWALTIAFVFQFFWPFYEASLWSFNPFPLVPLAILLVIFLTKFLLGERKFYYFALIVVLLSINADVAGAAVFILFFTLIGLIGVRNKILTKKSYLISALLTPLVAVVGILVEFIHLFIKTKVVSYEASGIGVFSGTNFVYMAQEFLKLFAGVVNQQNILIGILLFFFITVLYFKVKKPEKSVHKFIVLTFVFTLVSYLFFSTNKGWKDWHTVYLSPLLFITFMLMLSQIKKQIAIPILILTIAFQTSYFSQRLTSYMKPTDDPSILYNELAAVDWTYQKSEDQGFSVYNYTDRFYDNPYQYLYWWHGLKKYGYLPCEYSNFPLSSKSAYVEGYEHYLEPKRGCDRISFLIIQSDTNGNQNTDWIKKYREYHTLIESTKVGRITIEKYYRKIGAPNDFCIWLEKC